MDGRRQVRRPGEQRRPQIAAAALELIGQHGLRRFTTPALARRIRVSDAAVFRHFPSKRAVVAAVIERVEALLFEGGLPLDGDPLARLGRFFVRRVARVAAERGIARLMFSEELEAVAGRAGAARVAEMKRRSMDFVRACLDEARAAGVLDPRVGSREGVVLVTGALMALVYGRSAPRPAAIIAREGRRVWAVLEQLLRRRPRQRRAGGRLPAGKRVRRGR